MIRLTISLLLFTSGAVYILKNLLRDSYNWTVEFFIAKLCDDKDKMRINQIRREAIMKNLIFSYALILLAFIIVGSLEIEILTIVSIFPTIIFLFPVNKIAALLYYKPKARLKYFYLKHELMYSVEKLNTAEFSDQQLNNTLLHTVGNPETEISPSVPFQDYLKQLYSYIYDRKSEKNWFIALALCVFFGIFGLHRFYVGREKTGALWLCTGGILGFGVLIDIVQIIVQVFKDKDNKFVRL